MPDNVQDPTVTPPTDPVIGQAVDEPAVVQPEDLSTLFSPEDVAAKKASIAAAQAEEARRANLTPEALKAEDKAKAEADVLNVVPEEYGEFAIPEGMQIDKELLAEAVPLFKELGLSQAKAQKVLDLYAAKVMPAVMKRQADAWTEQKEAWLTAVKADKEVGGDKFDGAVKDAQRVLNTIGTPELKKVFDDYGLGNHPEFVRVFARMAQQLKEDTIETTKINPPEPTGVERYTSALYPD